jgi:Holliday junction resolvasome RuvABC endonuclease subunit
MDELKYIGIDQSYTSCGVVVLDATGQILSTDRIVSDKSVDIYERAWYISRQVAKIVERNKPCKVGIEGLAFGMRGDATRDLAGLLFCIINNLRYNHNFGDIKVVTPLSVKKFATGSGKAKKEDMYKHLPEKTQKIFLEKGFKKSNGLADIVDANWIAQYIRSE